MNILPLALLLADPVADLVTFSVDVTADTDAPSPSSELARGVAERLEQEGFSLGRPADVNVFVDARTDHVLIRMVGARHDEFQVESGPPAILELEVAHHITASLEHLSTHRPGQEPTPAPTDDLASVAPVHDPEQPPGLRRSPTVHRQADLQRPPMENAARLSTHAGFYGRPQVVDPVFGFGIRLGKASGVNVGGTVEFIPSHTPTLSVLETLPGLALGARVGRRRVTFHGDAIVGLLVHDVIWGGGLGGHTRAIDLALTAPLGISVWMTRGLDVDLSFRTGFSSRRHRHDGIDGTVWTRGIWRFGASLGFTYGWELR